MIATPQRPQAAPSPEAVDTFFEVLGKAVSAATQNRSLRGAEYFGRAASAALALWSDKGTLCVVHSKIVESVVLVGHATATALDDATPLWLEAQRLLAECRRILDARLDANTCLFGRCFAVEEDFYARYKVMLLEASGVALTTKEKAACQKMKHEVGYEACLDAAYRGLQFAYPAVAFRGVRFAYPEESLPPLTGDERSEAQAFALRCVGIMANTPRMNGTSEQPFAKLLRALLASDYLEQPFKGELTRAWDRPTLQNALRARGVFNEEDAAIWTNTVNMLKKNTLADQAKHGFRWCALPSCAKQETHVFDFKACSACKAVVYCSAEHGALHWTRGHRKECASLKAAGAKPRSTADEGDGGAGGGVTGHR